MAKPGRRPAAPLPTEVSDAEPERADVRHRLLAAAVAVLVERGFAHASARAVATRAGVAPGVIYYHFGSMDSLLGEVHRQLVDERLERIRAGLRDATPDDWVDRMISTVEAEFSHPDGAASVELVVGSKTSPALAEVVRGNLDASIDATAELASKVMGDSPLGSLVPTTAVAEIAAAAFFGAEVMAEMGRPIDIEAIARPLAQMLKAFRPS